MGCMIQKMVGCGCLDIPYSDNEDEAWQELQGRHTGAGRAFHPTPSTPEPCVDRDDVPGPSGRKSGHSSPPDTEKKGFDLQEKMTPKERENLAPKEQGEAGREEQEEAGPKGQEEAVPEEQEEAGPKGQEEAVTEEDSLWCSDSISRVKELKVDGACLIYKVRHRVSRTTAVLKVAKEPLKKVPPSKYTSEDYIWNAVSSHPYIADLLGSFVSEDKVCLVSEYLPGGDLKSIIRSHRSLPIEIVQIISAQITSAILYIHSKEVFHRNISNKNILISGNGKAKLSNFDNAVLSNTSRGLHGSFYYQAPEVFEGEIYDMTADWFSFGACLYEMIAEVTPIENHCSRLAINFKNLDFAGKVVALLTSTVHIPSYFPKDLKSVLEGFLQKDPKKRLGYRDREEPIKKHPFFAKINWDEVENGLLVLRLPVTLQL